MSYCQNLLAEKTELVSWLDSPVSISVPYAVRLAVRHHIYELEQEIKRNFDFQTCVAEMAL